MNSKRDNFLKELLEDFRVEAAEHYLAMTNGLMQLEKTPQDEVYSRIIESVYRETHSLKGAARAVSLSEVERLCQSLESVFSDLKQKKIKAGPELLRLVHRSFDHLSDLLAEINQQKRSGNRELSAKLIEELQNSNKLVPSTASETNPDEKGSSSLVHDVPSTPFPEPPRTARETIRVPVEKLSAMLLNAEEFLPFRNTLNHNVKQISGFLAELRKSGFGKTHAEELRPFLENLERSTRSMEQLRRISGRMVDDLILGIRGLLLVPFSSLTDIFPKIVRDLGRELGKEAVLTIQGGEVEIDRRILEEMKDPLIHLIRNCMDHGIEPAARRTQAGKTASGNIKVSVTRKSSVVEVEVRDDGAGINREALIESAIRNGQLSAERVDSLSEKEVYSLVFSSGVSTSKFVTDISGRGLGLAIVSEKVQRLGGHITLSSQKDHGSCFNIVIPVRMTTFRGILIRIAEHHFLIPDSFVTRAMRISPGDIRHVENQPVIILGGKAVPLAYLGEILEIPVQPRKQSESTAEHGILVTSGERDMVCIVDEVLGEEEGIVKQPGGAVRQARSISGAVILGNGKVAPVLNIQELLDAPLRAASGTMPSADNTKETALSNKQILIAEDSITARTLLRNILETAGYSVRTAIDGLDALGLLRNGNFDLLVSDVEMPLMNGFELLTKLRSDKRFIDLPVILVTALDSAADRQRGLECGANAYIVKSDFGQSNLLEVINRFI